MCKMIFFIIFITSSNYAIAFDVVFRQDGRSPEVIFNDGFHSLGEDDDILSHVNGESCISGMRNSAFVSTTTDNSVAVEMGQQVRAGDAYWVYSIRPTDTFYSAYNSLMYAYADSNNNIFRETAILFQPQLEYMAFGGIVREQIIGAWLYRSHGMHQLPERLSYTPNPYYEPAGTDVNQNPYRIYYHPSPSSSLVTCDNCLNSSSPFISEEKNKFPLKVIWCKRLTAFMLIKK